MVFTLNARRADYRLTTIPPNLFHYKRLNKEVHSLWAGNPRTLDNDPNSSRTETLLTSLRGHQPVGPSRNRPLLSQIQRVRSGVDSSLSLYSYPYRPLSTTCTIIHSDFFPALDTESNDRDYWRSSRQQGWWDMSSTRVWEILELDLDCTKS